MGPGETFVRRQVALFRSGLERAVVERAGSVNVAQASRIHTAAVALRRHLQAERRLAKDGAGMTLEQWTGLADRSVKWKEAVDRGLTALGLDAAAKPVDEYGQWLEQAQRQLAAQQAAAALAPPPAAPPAESRPDSPPSGLDAATGEAQLANGNQESTP
jgi:hypothetical protein